MRAADGAGRAGGVLKHGSAMRALLIAALATFALVGAAGCGGDDESAFATPETTPDLTVPSAPAAEADAAEDDETSTTSTTSTTGDEDADTGDTGGTAAGDAPAASGGTPATQTPTPAPAPAPAPDDTGGTAQPEPQAPPEETGGAEAGGTSDFCAENPGAC